MGHPVYNIYLYLRIVLIPYRVGGGKPHKNKLRLYQPYKAPLPRSLIFGAPILSTPPLNSVAPIPRPLSPSFTRGILLLWPFYGDPPKNHRVSEEKKGRARDLITFLA